MPGIVVKASGESKTSTSRVAGAPLVLIADDAEDTRELYESYLTLSRVGTCLAADGAEALRQAEAERPDVIVLDIRLPVLDGWEVTRRLKRNPKTSHIFVIMLSGETGAESVAKSLAVGCDLFLTKPCLPEHLLDQILATQRRVTVA